VSGPHQSHRAHHWRRVCIGGGVFVSAFQQVPGFAEASVLCSLELGGDHDRFLALDQFGGNDVPKIFWNEIGGDEIEVVGRIHAFGGMNSADIFAAPAAEG